MGLITNNSNASFISIVGGKFAKRVDEKTENSVSRVLKKGKNEGQTVWEEHYDAIEGVISDIKFDSTDFGIQLRVTIKDDKTFIISTEYSSGYARSLMLRLPNVNLNDPLTLRPYNFENNGKNIKGISIFQGGVKIAPYWDKNNQRDLPQPVLKKRPSGDEWDWSDHIDYLYNYTKDNVASNLNVVNEQDGNDDSDGLPF